MAVVHTPSGNIVSRRRAAVITLRRSFCARCVACYIHRVLHSLVLPFVPRDHNLIVFSGVASVSSTSQVWTPKSSAPVEISGTNTVFSAWSQNPLDDVRELPSDDPHCPSSWLQTLSWCACFLN